MAGKRPKSPETEEDARYFTVHQPYPLNAQWVLEDDQKQCAMWVAECIGADHLWAIHEKPKARGMILLEVSKEFKNHSCFLGEHRWAEFLKDPTEEQKPGVTQVFHSFYGRGRDAQKDGWKVITIKSSWFEDWEPGEGDIKQPYPDTHWCSVPVEDITNKTLCRPLPVELKPPPPPRKQPPVVGSSKWAAKQVADPPSQIAPTSSWSNNSGIVAAAPPKVKGPAPPPPVSDESHWPDVAALPISAVTKPGPANNRATGKPGGKGWGKPVPLKVLNASTSKVATQKQWDKLVSTASDAKSPLAEEPPTGPVNAWDKPIKLPPSNRPNHSPRSPAPESSIDASWAADFTPASNSTDNNSTTPLFAADLSRKKESQKRASSNAINSSRIATSDNSSERPAGGAKKTLKKLAAPSIHATGGNAARSEMKNEKNRPDATANRITVSSDTPSVRTPQEEKKRKAKTVQPIEDLYSEFHPAADPDELSVFLDFQTKRGPEAEADAFEWGPAGAETVGYPTSNAEASSSNAGWAFSDDGNRAGANAEKPGPTPDEEVDYAAGLVVDQKKPEPLICPTHGITCGKGICRDMAKLVREQKMAQAKSAQAKKQKAKSERVRSDTRKMPSEARGSPQSSQVREIIEPSSIGKMRAFEDLGQEEGEEEEEEEEEEEKEEEEGEAVVEEKEKEKKGSKRDRQPKISPWQTQSDPSDWL